MLFLVTLFASFLLVSSKDVVPSAHLEGGVPQVTDVAVNEVIKAWNPSDPSSHVLNGFEYADGILHVPRPGRYYVYVQLYFNQRPHPNNNRIVVASASRTLLMIHEDMSAGQENTGFSGGVFRLNAGEGIFVKVIGYNTKLWLGPNHSYFGAYQI